jgi:hypothetical protein
MLWSESSFNNGQVPCGSTYLRVELNKEEKDDVLSVMFDGQMKRK